MLGRQNAPVQDLKFQSALPKLVVVRTNDPLGIAAVSADVFIVDFILEAVGYTTARIIVPLISFGNVRVQALSSHETGFNWLGFKGIASGGFLYQTTMAGSIGLLPWALLLFVVVPYVLRS